MQLVVVIISKSIIIAQCFDKLLWLKHFYRCAASLAKELAKLKISSRLTEQESDDKVGLGDCKTMQWKSIFVNRQVDLMSYWDQRYKLRIETLILIFLNLVNYFRIWIILMCLISILLNCGVHCHKSKKSRILIYLNFVIILNPLIR